jgi:hypothetical protein
MADEVSANALQDDSKAEQNSQQDVVAAAETSGEATAAVLAPEAAAAAVVEGAGGQEPSATSSPPAQEVTSTASTPTLKRGSNTVANKIAAFSSGVAPVKAGMDTSAEDDILVEEVLHKLEAASRVSISWLAVQVALNCSMPACKGVLQTAALCSRLTQQ